MNSSLFKKNHNFSFAFLVKNLRNKNLEINSTCFANLFPNNFAHDLIEICLLKSCKMRVLNSQNSGTSRSVINKRELSKPNAVSKLGDLQNHVELSVLCLRLFWRRRVRRNGSLDLQLEVFKGREEIF